MCGYLFILLEYLIATYWVGNTTYWQNPQSLSCQPNSYRSDSYNLSLKAALEIEVCRQFDLCIHVRYKSKGRDVVSCWTCSRPTCIILSQYRETSCINEFFGSIPPHKIANNRSRSLSNYFLVTIFQRWKNSFYFEIFFITLVVGEKKRKKKKKTKPK